LVAQAQLEQAAVVGEVVYVDVFSNLITNVPLRHVKEVREITKRPNPLIRIGGHSIDGLVRCYAEGDHGAPRAVINRDRQLESFWREPSASAVLNVPRHEPVKLS